MSDNAQRVLGTGSQTSTIRREDARFYAERGCKYLQMLLKFRCLSWLIGVYVAVSMRLVMVHGDGDEQEVQRDDRQKRQKKRQKTTAERVFAAEKSVWSCVGDLGIAGCGSDMMEYNRELTSRVLAAKVYGRIWVRGPLVRVGRARERLPKVPARASQLLVLL